MNSQHIKEYYNTDCNEADRLSRDLCNSIEYLTTIHFLTKYIPANSTVLDCCAGGGVYAFPLAKMGHKVTAGDLVAEHIDILKTKNKDSVLCEIYQGDVLDLSRFEENSFDVVLCLGALYHLHNQTDREKCVSECLRVLKRGGIFMFAYINRNAVYINHFKNNISDIEDHKVILETGANDVFYVMDFNEPTELTSKFALKKITDIGIDGLRYPLNNEINACTTEEFEAYMDYHLATCEQPSIIGHSMHGLWIGRKL